MASMLGLSAFKTASFSLQLRLQAVFCLQPAAFSLQPAAFSLQPSAAFSLQLQLAASACSLQLGLLYGP